MVALASLIYIGCQDVGCQDVGCQQGTTSSARTASAQSPSTPESSQEPVYDHASERAYVEPALEALDDLLAVPGAPKARRGAAEESEALANARTKHAGAACAVSEVWAFVDQARQRYSACDAFPSEDALHQVSCADIEWMVLDSGCIPPALYFEGPMLETAHAQQSSRSVQVRDLGWQGSYCQVRHNQMNPDHSWRSFVRFDDAGKIVCHPTDQTCAYSRECSRKGLCQADGPHCKAALHSHCNDSQACANEGRCVAANGACRVESDSDCAESVVCKRSGRCSAVDGTCQITSDADCQRSDPCQTRGQCSAVDGACRASSDADCQKNDLCTQRGLCSAVEGVCVATSSEECALSQTGTIFVADGCYPVGPMNCRQSDLCREQGKCVADAQLNSCEKASKEACAQWTDCSQRGQCSPVDGVCQAASDADCKKSSDCDKYGRCTAVDGICVGGDEDTTDPKVVGRWVQLRDGGPSADYGLSYMQVGRADRFLAGTRGCKDTEACKKYGLCDKKGHYCVPTKKSCERAEHCKSEGYCTLSPRDGEQRYCARATDEDCKQSKLCEDKGKCRLRGAHTTTPECVGADEIPTVCPPSEVLVSGECRLQPTFDCSKTKACAEHGFGCQTRVVRARTGRKLDQPFAQCVNGQDYCASTKACSERGQCQTNSRSATEALSQIEKIYECIDEHGKVTPWCYRDVEDPCLVTESACKKSAQCKEEGRCAAWEHYNECWPEGRGDCARSEACEIYGYCGERYRSPMSECSPEHTVHCLQSKRCRDKGLCKFDSKTGTCVEPEDELAKTDPCRKTAACERYGRCATDVRSGTCVARWPQDCASSDACTVYGRCSVIDGMCRPTEAAHCQESTTCADGGRCELRHGACQTEAFAAALDAVCSAHELCEDGTCAAMGTRSGCDLPLAEDELGSAGQTVTRPPATAKAQKPRICALTEGCQKRGDCQLLNHDYHYESCKPGRDADCEQSEACKRSGACGVISEERWRGGGAPTLCAPTRAEHCPQARICKEEGLCATIKTSRGSAGAPPSKECMATSDAHCRQSQACTNEQRCTARSGGCIED
jgi:hypothetical protein